MAPKFAIDQMVRVVPTREATYPYDEGRFDSARGRVEKIQIDSKGPYYTIWFDECRCRECGAMRSTTSRETFSESRLVASP